jgi:predicted pyridoxine 5'-phosphate oxidase superfamily flavin-nucleotide-binding protein
MKYPSDIVFTPSVKKFQKYYKSRSSYARMEETRGWNTKVTNDLAEFLTEIDSFYLGTANLNGQPYIQHRGGNKGFLKVIDEEHLGFVDFSGNKQYISIGNLSENSKATIFLMHYPSQTRIKIWGTAKVIEDANTIMSLKDDYNAKVERAIVFKIVAWDINCRQHIKQRYSIDQIEKIIEPLKKRINELEKELENRK